MAVRRIKHRPVPGRASTDLLRDFFNVHRTVPGRCHFTLNNFTKRRTGAVEFLVVPKLHRAPYDVLKMFKNRTILPAAGRSPYGRRRIVRFLVK